MNQPLSQSQIESFQRGGFAIVRGLYQGAAMARIAAWVDEIAASPEVPGQYMMYFEQASEEPGRRLLNRIENSCPYDAGLYITALVGIDATPRDNGCLELVAGRHREEQLGPNWAPLPDEATASMEFVPCETAPGDEPLKVCVRVGRIVEFGKPVAPDPAFDVCGEPVGFFRLSVQTCRELVARASVYLESSRGQEPHEEALRDLMLEAGPARFGAGDLTGLPWIEIDFPEDVEWARQEILARLQR